MSTGNARFILGCCAAGAVVFLGTQAHGGANDQPYPVGELSSTMGGAGVATVHDGSSPWHNPAGLGRVTEEGISATLNVYGLQTERTPGFFDTADLKGTATAIFPGLLGYVKPLSDPSSPMQHALGLAVVIPDFARHELALDDTIQESDVGYELHVRERLLEQTLWIVPGWGACLGPNLCFGVALNVGYWSSTGLYSYSEQYKDPDGALGSSQVNQEEYSAVLVTGSLGAQWQMSNGFWLGGSLRLPARTVWGGGNLLVMDGQWDESGGTPDWVRRFSDDKMKIDQRLPLNMRLGVGYDRGLWLLALDLSLSLPQASYASVRTRNGETQVQPKDANLVDIGPPVDVGQDDERDAIFNVTIGAQYRLSPKMSVQGGFFTDFSGRPDSVIDPIHNHMNHYGITAGVGMKGSSSLTFVGIVAVLGSGRSYAYRYDDALADFAVTKADATSTAIYFTLGGSTRLGEAPEPKAPPTPLPPPAEEMQPPATPAAPTVAPTPLREEKAQPPSKAKRKVKAKRQAPE